MYYFKYQVKDFHKHVFENDLNLIKEINVLIGVSNGF
jgi:hypothetical protein